MKENEKHARNFKDLTGKRFGLLSVSKLYCIKNRKAYWLCKCDCGKEKVIESYTLRTKENPNCGCYSAISKRKKLSEKNKTHGLSKTRLFTIWQGMKQRCFYKKAREFHNYGGRGITICDEWKNDFKAFYDWSMSNGYKENLTIDRIDVNGNYEPKNCRWITHKEQCYNTRYNVFLTYKGEKKTITEWSKEKGINYATIQGRIKRRWNENEILETRSNI